MMPFGPRPADLAKRTAFYFDPFRYNSLFTTNAVDPSTDQIAGAYGEMYTPSGVAFVHYSAAVYPLSNAAMYLKCLVDGVSYHTMGYIYFNAGGWALPATFQIIIDGLDRYKLHSFSARSSFTGAGQSSYIYAGYGGVWPIGFWGMNMPDWKAF